MLVLATNRADFSRTWEDILSKRGELRLAHSLSELHEVLLSAEAKLLLIDLELPDSRNPTTLRSLQLACNGAKMLLGGIAFEPMSELAGLSMGASACLDASLPLEECARIIDVVMQGGIWLSSAGIPALLGKLQNLSTSQQKEPTRPEQQPFPAIADEDFSKLTRREREVAQLVSNGANNKTIARQLLITDRTVKAHLTSIFDKLNIPDRLQLALRVSSRETTQR